MLFGSGHRSEHPRSEARSFRPSQSTLIHPHIDACQARLEYLHAPNQHERPCHPGLARRRRHYTSRLPADLEASPALLACLLVVLFASGTALFVSAGDAAAASFASEPTPLKPKLSISSRSINPLHIHPNVSKRLSNVGRGVERLTCPSCTGDRLC